MPNMNRARKISLVLSAATLLLVVGVEALIYASAGDGPYTFGLSLIGGGCLLFVPTLITLAAALMVREPYDDEVRVRR